MKKIVNHIHKTRKAINDFLEKHSAIATILFWIFNLTGALIFLGCVVVVIFGPVQEVGLSQAGPKQSLIFFGAIIVGLLLLLLFIKGVLKAISGG